jgi:Zn-dependent protease with chaperone function
MQHKETSMNFSPRDFIHPEDHAALENLKSLPLFSACVKTFMKAISEQFLHGINMAQKVRLGPEQLPEIYQYLPPVCAAFGIEEPEFYLEMNPSPNAYTYGDTRVFITVTSGLVEHLEEDEMQAVVAHECGHIVCQHVLYHTIADMLIKTGSAMGSALFTPMSLMSEPIKLALLYWYRRSELSADRAAAVFLKGSKSVVDVMVRLAGGPKSITGKVNMELYTRQAEAYDKLQDSKWDKLLQGLAIMYQDHPFLSVRTREIVHWCESEHFQRLLQTASEAEKAAAAARCSGCGKPLQEHWKFCSYCGHPHPGVVTASTDKESLHG